MKIKLLAILCLSSVGSFSQTNDSIQALDEVRIEGVRANKNSPIPQITIYRNELQKFNHGYEGTQILDDTPSITSNSDGGHSYGYTYFRIRGIDQTRINMTLNGVPLNEPEDQGAYFSNLPNFIESISSMQIQRGVGTSTNGVSSYGGSINFIGNTGETPTTDVKLTTGSFNTKLVNFGIGTGLFANDKFSFFVNLSSYETDGYREKSGGTGLSYYLGAAYHGGKNVLRATLFTGNTRNDMAWLPVSENDIRNNPRTNYNVGNAKDNFSQTLFQLEYNRLLNNNSKMSVTGFHTHLSGEYDYYMVGKNFFFLESNLFGINTNFNKKYDNGEVNIGVNGNTYTRTHKSTFTEDLFKNEGHKNEGNAYIKVNHSFGNFNIFGDIQYRFVDFSYKGSVYMPTKSWNFFNPKIGFKVKVEDETEFYALIGKTHREPTRSNLFGGSSNLVELSDIVYEEVIDYELGFNTKNGDLNVNYNFYYMDFKNEITTNGEYGANSLLLFYNLPKSYRAGIEINAKYKFNSKLSLTYNNNLSHNGIDGSKFEQLYSPKNIQNLTMLFNFKRFSSSINAKYHSKSFIDVENKNSTPEFIIFNANLGYTYEIFSIYLSMLNITNQEYFTNGNVDTNGRNYFANAPLNYNLTFKISL